MQLVMFAIERSHCVSQVLSNVDTEYIKKGQDFGEDEICGENED